MDRAKQSKDRVVDHVYYVQYGHITHILIARVWINRVRLPILLVVSRTGKMNTSLSPFAPENLVSRNVFGSPVPLQPAHLHTQAESGVYLWDSSRVIIWHYLSNEFGMNVARPLAKAS